MKSRFPAIIVLFCFALMLLFPKPVFSGASEGLLLWFHTVLPTLLPFIIISNLMIHTSALDLASFLAKPVLCRILGVSPYGSFAVLSGFLCGYPMGAKVTADLIRSGHISLSEGKYLLSFCNNTSPMFIISYIVLQSLNRAELILPSIVLLFVSPLFMSFLFRRFYRPTGGFPIPCTDTRHSEGRSFHFGIVDTCLMDGFEAIVKVGGYIMLFSIFIKLAGLLPIHHPVFSFVLLPMLEITNGIPILCQTVYDPKLTYILVMALSSFGGLCAAAQTSCMIQGTGLKALPYVAQKLATMLVTSLLAAIYVYAFH